MARFNRGYDPQTGEIGLLVPLDQGHKIISREQSEAYKVKRRKESGGSIPKFTFTDANEIAQVIRQLDDKNCGYLLLLQTYIDYDTNIIVYGQGQDKSL